MPCPLLLFTAQFFRLPPPCGEGGGGGRTWYTLPHPSLALPLKGRGPEILTFRRSRRGLTLIELLLVLVLLVVMGSLVMPVFTGGFASVRLRRAGDQVISRWAGARARAIETGEVIQFRFAPETGSYQVEVWTGPIDGEERTSATSPASVETAAPTATRTTDDGTEKSAALPEEIVFQSGQIAVDDPLAGERRVETMQETGSDLSTAILFFPDGTSSNASVVLSNDHQQFLRLTLRGLTGIARASDVLTRDELESSSRSR